MFNKNDTEIYKSIKIPKNIKSEILSDCSMHCERKIPHNTVRSILSVAAACIVLLFTVFSLIHAMDHDIIISVNGHTVMDAEIVIDSPAPISAYERNIAPETVSIPIMIESGDNITVTVNNGIITPDENGENRLSSEKTTCSGKSGSVLYWVVEISCEGEVGRMFIKSTHSSTTLILNYDFYVGTLSLTRE